MSEGVLSPFFRKLNIDEKREQLAKVFGLSADECEANNGSLLQNELSDLMVNLRSASCRCPWELLPAFLLMERI